MDELQQKAFEYFGALAFVILGLMGALVWITKQWMAALDTIKTMHAERLADVREQGKVGEAMRDTMAANTMALQANTDIMKTVVARERDH